MLGKVIMKIALILLLLAPSAFANFPLHKATRIVDASDGTELYYSDVCVDGNNQVHVIWSQTVIAHPHNHDHLYYRRFSGVGEPTSAIAEFTPPGSILNGQPRIYSNRDSKVVVTAAIKDTLTDAISWNVWYSDGSGVFDPPIQYSTDQPYTFAKGRAGLGMNKAGRTAIAWENTSELYQYGNSTYYEVRDETNQKIDSTRGTGTSEFRYMNAIVNQVAMNSSGNFVIVWSANFAGDQHWFQEWGFFPMQPIARVFDALGNPLTNEIYVACEGFPATCAGDSNDFVNAHASGQRPDVVIDESGEFSVLYCRDGAWACEKQHYFLRRFYANGTPKGSNIRVDDLTECFASMRQSRLMSDSSGNLLAIWCNNNIDGYDNWWCNMYAQRYDPNGQRIGINYRLNDIPATFDSGIFGDQFGADMNEQGLVAIVWLDKLMFGPASGVCLQTMDVHNIGFFTPGDANRDLLVNISDPVFLINYIFAGGTPPVAPCLGDANGDDMVNISDAVNLINYIFNGGNITGECL